MCRSRGLIRREFRQMLPNDLLEGAVRFHGHLGPFLILGLRAGLLGIDRLGKSYFEVRAIVETSSYPPRSCFIDGIQFASGCTVGKNNLEVKTSSSVSVEFIRGERRIHLVVRDTVLRALGQMTSDKVEVLSREILEKADDELFLIRSDWFDHKSD